MRTVAGACWVVGVLASVCPAHAEADTSAREIVAKAIKAHGGEKAIKKHKASIVKSKGKFHGQGDALDFTGTASIQMPDRNRLEVEFDANGQKITFIRVFDGDKGWHSFNNMADDLSKEAIAEGQEEQYAQSVERLAPLTDKSYKLTALGESKVGDHPVLGVKVEREGHRPVSLFFDKEKNVLLKSETHGKDPMNGGKEFTAEKTYGDYKKVDGVMVAHKITIKRDGKNFVESEVTEAKFVDKLDDGLLVKP